MRWTAAIRPWLTEHEATLIGNSVGDYLVRARAVLRLCLDTESATQDVTPVTSHPLEPEATPLTSALQRGRRGGAAVPTTRCAAATAGCWKSCSLGARRRTGPKSESERGQGVVHKWMLRFVSTENYMAALPGDGALMP